MDSVIKLENIIKEYGETRVLFGINLNIKRGEFCSIIGQSGSGKSTLLNIIGTLDKQTSGKVIINGTDTTANNDLELAKLRNLDIGFIFQFHHLLPEFSVLENVLMPSYIDNKMMSKKNEQYALELLDLVEMKKYAYRNANELSGGQKQRVAIARALMNKPAIILADEPTGNLDSVTTEIVYDLFSRINRELDTTIIIITHDKEIAQKTERVIEIIDGKITADITRD